MQFICINFGAEIKFEKGEPDAHPGDATSGFESSLHQDLKVPIYTLLQHRSTEAVRVNR